MSEDNKQELLNSVVGKLYWAAEQQIAIKWFQFHKPKQVAKIRRLEKDLAALKKEVVDLLTKGGSCSLQEAEDYVEAEVERRFNRRLAQHEAKKAEEALKEAGQAKPIEQTEAKGAKL